MKILNIVKLPNTLATNIKKLLKFQHKEYKNY